MQKYGNEIQYDITKKEILLEVSTRLAQAVREKFTKDYGLNPMFEEVDFGGTHKFVFNKSIDSETFLRHLYTMSAKQYEALC